MATTVHPPPAGIDDFARRPDMAEAMAQGWDAIVNDWLDGAAGYYGDETNPSLFYNAQRDDTPGAGATDDAVWDAFPLAITKWFAGDFPSERAGARRTRRGPIPAGTDAWSTGAWASRST
jgi:hypothetical protein